MESLENVKVGDRLIVHERFDTCITEVERVTATLVITKHGRFRKKTGMAQGNCSWSSSWVTIATPAEVERVEVEAKRRELIEKCRRIEFCGLSGAQLEEILEIANREERV